MLSGLIQSLELDLSLFIQFGIFLVSYVFLHYVLFKPYNEKAQERYTKTTGSIESANQFDEEIELLKREYGKTVKKTNTEIKQIHEAEQLEAKKEVQTLIQNAQESYQKEKQMRSEEIEKAYITEKSKIPSLSKELKDSLKKVLINA